MWIAGGQNFAFKTGRHLKYTHPANDGGPTSAKGWQAVSRVHVAIAQKFGININTFGNMDPGTGPLPML
jgi:hypothetical protein